ncbi:MAG: tRNA lysidine(34) synthetase TilS [Aquabacterium sp.]|jgi:tRNA(Ile)-lysidine synthase|uniref:tRNA lysidine(34) synthetase TilS n=1 Tax=Aquabacterium sp. TaxID=1872578 RepID=UPI002A3602AE|nr:tRNA lysidine(34) synthetase TilS [Aquabacterium sp.]MDX9842692.1 tRNA lysidine(34) synthetase TilS [Aquabacterium sp.]
MMAGLEPVCVAVAYSGGRDSTALLHATAVAARDWPGVTVVALHVHHGLSAQADDWLQHAEAVCQAWVEEGLPLRLLCRRVGLRLSAGDSVEAVARAARHAALQEMAQEAGADLLLLAHHRQDQAETLLLQALRGGGLAGLAGIPRDVIREGVRWVRPWLDHARSAIEAYVAAYGLTYIDDDSNADPRYARNLLRLSVWPALVSAFPDAEVNLAASARRLADALPVVDAWRLQALPPLLAQPVDAGADDVATPMTSALDARRWAVQSGALRRETLRHWYRQVSGQVMPATWVERLAEEAPRMLSGQGAAQWSALKLSLYRGVLSWGGDVAPEVEAGQREEVQLSLRAAGGWPVAAWGGCLVVREVSSGGVPRSLLADVVLRQRVGGEQFQMGAGRPPRSLKKQFQALGVPAWQRGGPLVFAGEQLIYVPGLGIDARVQAPEGTPQWSIEWLPDAISQ